MLYIKERKEIEVGGANITVNGKKINKADHPMNYNLIQSIRKEYSDLFKKFGIDFNQKYPDIIIDGDTLILNDEQGNELLKTSINDTKLVKTALK